MQKNRYGLEIEELRGFSNIFTKVMKRNWS